MEKYLLPRKLAFLFLSGLASACIASGLLGLSMEHLAGNLPVFCPFEAITGLQCPGCGMTRALGALAAGNIIGALEQNPFVFLLLFISALSMAPTAYIRRQPRRASRLLSTLFAVSLPALIARWLLVEIFPRIMR